ncbi:hypothetical protein BHE90_000569 [Fusarium euwallaceae]|uniref:Uncharacterized protein n=1 Tax=Fusarium euwallaceae TaxID=1147111 RepID=A0A430MA27_9HYPO|nr:hypothetical protein BHE90_000569 [Fusarium euwallaceae]
MQESTTMRRLVALALHHRDNFSHGRSRQVFGYEAYHWAIMIMPEPSQGPDCYSFDATDSSGIDPVTFRMNNPTMDWWFRVQENIDPTLSEKLIGRIIIGEVPDGVSSADLQSLFEGIELPVKNRHPQQSCVTWVLNAIRALQKKGWAWDFELDQFKDVALSYADERMKGGDSSEPSVKHYNV